eukprot:2161833-Rhodomonas_salina.1
MASTAEMEVGTHGGRRMMTAVQAAYLKKVTETLNELRRDYEQRQKRRNGGAAEVGRELFATFRFTDWYGSKFPHIDHCLSGRRPSSQSRENTDVIIDT